MTMSNSTVNVMSEQEEVPPYPGEARAVPYAEDGELWDAQTLFPLMLKTYARTLLFTSPVVNADCIPTAAYARVWLQDAEQLIVRPVASPRLC